MNVYLAAPLFTNAERRFNLEICHALEAAGHPVYLPQRDTAEATGPGRTRRLFAANLAGLAGAEAVVAVLDGAQVDDGTAWELGWAHARGIPIFGLRTDRRTAQQPDEPVNLMIFESLRRLVTSSADLLASLGV
ncbi:MAG TPA: nucleoside 2-deoxyribosyltransferase [Methylomirabilota bacterium]|nr:nucleoside 2-deoxyribosyltransferase [Methylomirabilota bacterium]